MTIPPMPVATRSRTVRACAAPPAFLRGVLDDGSVAELPLASRPCQRAPGELYGGQAHPGTLPTIPATMFSAGGPLVYGSDGAQFFRAMELPPSSWFRRAHDLAAGCRASLPEPLKSYADAYAVASGHLLPHLVRNPDAPSAPPVDRERWLLAGVQCTRPAALSATQARQAAAAAFWARYPGTPADVTHMAVSILDYYRQGGYEVVPCHINDKRQQLPHVG